MTPEREANDAGASGGGGGFFPAGAFFFGGETLEVLAIDFFVQSELALQLGEGRGLGAEDEIDVVAAIERAGDVGELAAIHFLDLLDDGAFVFEIAFEAFDDFFDAFVAAFDIEDQKSFVTVFHKWSGVEFQDCAGVSEFLGMARGFCCKAFMAAASPWERAQSMASIGAGETLLQRGGFVQGKTPEDVADRPALGGADADAQARNGLGAEVFDDGLEAIVAARGARGPDAKASQREGHIIQNHENLGRLDLVKGAEGAARIRR